MSERAQKLLRWLGSGLTVLAILFVAVKIRDYGRDLDLGQVSPLWPSIALLALVYGCAALMLAMAWRDLLGHFGASIGSRLAIGIYGRSQLSKYIPGNVFQFVGRQALGLNAGLPMWPLAKSAVWEVGVQAACGSLFLLFILPFDFHGVPVSVAALIFAVAAAIALWVSHRWIGPAVARAGAWHIAFLVVAGLLFYCTTALVGPGKDFTLPTGILVCGAYVIAWLAGLLTPGSPAGLGVREVVLFALLRSTLGEGDLLVAIVLGRLVTLGGDIVFFVLAHAVGSKFSKPA